MPFLSRRVPTTLALALTLCLLPMMAFASFWSDFRGTCGLVVGSAQGVFGEIKDRNSIRLDLLLNREWQLSQVMEAAIQADLAKGDMIGATRKLLMARADRLSEYSRESASSNFDYFTTGTAGQAVEFSEGDLPIVRLYQSMGQSIASLTAPPSGMETIVRLSSSGPFAMPGLAFRFYVADATFMGFRWELLSRLEPQLRERFLSAELEYVEALGTKPEAAMLLKASNQTIRELFRNGIPSKKEFVRQILKVEQVTLAERYKMLWVLRLPTWQNRAEQSLFNLGLMITKEYWKSEWEMTKFDVMVMKEIAKQTVEQFRRNRR